MFSAKKIEKYESILSQLVSSESLSLDSIASSLYEKAVSVLHKLLANYHDELSASHQGSQKKWAQSLIKSLEAEPSKPEICLNTTLGSISSYINQSQSKESKSQPFSIRDDLFSLLLVYFRGFPEFIYKIMPDDHGIYALLLLGVFAYDADKLNTLEIFSAKLTTSANSFRWWLTFFEKTIPFLSGVVLGEVMDGILNHFVMNADGSRMIEQPAPALIYLHKILINNDALSPELMTRMSEMHSKCIDFQVQRCNAWPENSIMSGIEEFPLEKQKKLFNDIFSGLSSSREKYSREYYQVVVDLLIPKLISAVSVINVKVLHESVNNIFDYFFHNVGGEESLVSQAKLLSKIISRLVPDESVSRVKRDAILQWKKNFEIHKLYSLRVPLFMAYPAIARSTFANEYFNVKQQKKLLDNIFFNGKKRLFFPELNEICFTIAPDLYNASLQYLMDRLLVSDSGLSESDHFNAIVAFTAMVDHRKLIVSEKHIEFIVKEISRVFVNGILKAFFTLGYIRLLTALERSDQVSEQVKNSLINMLKLEETHSEFFILSYKEKQLTKCVLDNIPDLLRISSERQQKELLSCLRDIFLKFRIGIVGRLLLTIQYQLPNCADYIADKMIEFAECENIQESNPKHIPWMALICVEKVNDRLRQVEENRFLAFLSLLELFNIPNVLVLIIVKYCGSVSMNNECLRLDRLALARVREDKEHEKKEQEGKGHEHKEHGHKEPEHKEPEHKEQAGKEHECKEQRFKNRLRFLSNNSIQSTSNKDDPHSKNYRTFGS